MGPPKSPGKFFAESHAIQLCEDRVVVGGEIESRLGELVEEHDGGFIGRSKSAGDALKAFLDLVAGFKVRSLSRRTTTESGKGSVEKRARCCSWPSSKTRNSSLGRSGTQLAVGIFDGDGDGDEFRARTQHARRGDVAAAAAARCLWHRRGRLPRRRFHLREVAPAGLLLLLRGRRRGIIGWVVSNGIAVADCAERPRENRDYRQRQELPHNSVTLSGGSSASAGEAAADYSRGV